MGQFSTEIYNPPGSTLSGNQHSMVGFIARLNSILLNHAFVHLTTSTDVSHNTHNISDTSARHVTHGNTLFMSTGALRNPLSATGRFIQG